MSRRKTVWGIFLCMGLIGCVTTRSSQNGILINPAHAINADSFDYQRRYVPDEQYSYLLKRTYLQNGAWSSTGEALSHHKVSIERGVGIENVNWPTYWFKNKKYPKGRDLGNDAKSIGAYEISLDPNGPLEIPSLNLVPPSMVANVTDLNAFYVAISPQAGIRQLKQVGDHYDGKSVRGDWGGTPGTPTGEDCVQLRLELTGLSATTANVKTTFLPSPLGCEGFSFKTAWMVPPVSGTTANNFQEVTHSGKKFDVMWGQEEFTINSVIDRSSGKILSATMENPLHLKLKAGCDQNLENCIKMADGTDSAPVLIQRTIELKLLN
jgi:hypothetical protein